MGKGSSSACASMKDVSEFQLLPAISLTTGSCILTSEGPEEIIDIDSEDGFGVYSAVTYEADSLLVVNKVIASPFAVTHKLMDILYRPLRLVNYLSPELVASQNCMAMISGLGALLMS